MRTTSLSALAAGLAITVFVLIPHAAAAMNTTVNITDTAYIGKSIDIIPGDTVTWVNAGTANHTVTADNNSFGSGTLAPGATYSQAFTQVGNYPYHDGFNAAMTGTVRVVQQTPVPSTSSSAPVPTTPVTTTAAPANTTAQAQALLAQLVQLQQTLAALQAKANQSSGTTPVSGGTITPVGTASGTCLSFSRALKPGMSGSDVLRLQQFLAADVSVYPEGQATGYFGALTQVAVQRWQIKNNIVSSGTPETTGFGIVGPRTAAAMALQCSGGSTGGGSTAPVGGFIQVTPVTGVAPLQVSVQATVNTTESCAATSYTLDWGDATPKIAIPVPGGACSVLQQTYTHTYQYGGQYLVKLSAGGHESTATVTVSGSARPAGVGNFGGLAVTAPISGQTFNSGQTISIAWQTDSSFPSGASIVFDLYTGDGRRLSTTNDIIAITTYPSGNIAWTIPFGGGICPAIYPGKLCGLVIPTGSYKIVGRAYQNTGAVASGPIIAEASSGAFTIIGANASGGDTFAANITSGQPPLTVIFTGKLTSGNKAWCEGGCFNFLQFGDGGAEFLTLPVAGGTSLGYTVSHTYQKAGVYLAKLFQSLDSSGPLVGSEIKISVGNAGDNFTYGPLKIEAAAGSATAATATFDLPNACTKYSLAWGDGAVANSRVTSNCSSVNPTVITITHTYTAAGTYTVSLARGASLENKTSASITISGGVINSNICSVYSIASCPDGQGYYWSNSIYDANGCGRPNGTCVPVSQLPNCLAVEYTMPTCPTGQHVEDRFSGGCRQPYVCVAN